MNYCPRLGDAGFGTVRRCPHGRIWFADQYRHPLSGSRIWEQLSRWRTPIRYRRAVKALGGGDQP